MKQNKNIHVLPTEKPSNLFKDIKNKLMFNKEWIELPIGRVNQNIYITDNSEIKEGDFGFYKNKILKLETIQKVRSAIVLAVKKIILTTNQDLIKDGVQSIDDDFLEWFVKNPSCDSVEVSNNQYTIFNSEWKNFYKIIIPKEEPKFEDSIENSLSIMSIANDMFGKKEEPKQEKICTGCGTLSSEELGKNKLGENFLACCPDSDYVNVQEYQEYGLLQHIKFCLESGNEAQAIRLIEKYGFEMQEQDKKLYSEEEVEILLETLSKVLVYQGNDYRLPYYFEDEIEEVIKQFKNK
jgi:hypothetical protein